MWACPPVREPLLVNSIPFLGGAASSIIGAARVKEVKGLGTDLLRTGRLCAFGFSSELLPRDL